MRLAEVTANRLKFAALTEGPVDGPLALCLHGFPDSAHTWRYLLPDLAAAGFRAVGPWMRGYAPTAVPADGSYGAGALAADACALHEALGGDERAVLIGHDWGAVAAYGAANFAPRRWRRLVTGAVPPLGAIGTDYTATKAALAGYTRGAARDLARRGITVNILQAGLVDTDMSPADSEHAPAWSAAVASVATAVPRRSPPASRSWRARTPPTSPAPCSMSTVDTAHEQSPTCRDSRRGSC